MPLTYEKDLPKGTLCELANKKYIFITISNDGH